MFYRTLMKIVNVLLNNHPFDKGDFEFLKKLFLWKNSCLNTLPLNQVDLENRFLYLKAFFKNK